MAQGQRATVGQDPTPLFMNGRRTPATIGAASLGQAGGDADDRQQNDADPHAPQPEMTDQQHPQRCADYASAP